jgi:hypothetical protein
MDATERIEADGLCGVRLVIDGQKWEVTFNTRGELAGHVHRSGEVPAIDADLATNVQPQKGIMADSKARIEK